MSLHQFLRQRLAERRAADLYREVKTLAAAPAPQVRLAGRELLCFSSNDYLGLASHPDVIAAQQRGALMGAGATASHLVNGHLQIHEDLQQKIAEVTGREAALLFSSGYMANVGAVCALAGRGDTVIQDKLNHASLIDGARLSGADFLRFAHNDMQALARQLERADGNKLVAVDGVYSMDGDTAPLAQIAALCSEHNAWLMVDEAHGFGVMGSEQFPCAGSGAQAGLDAGQLPILMGTLGKAAGNAGAFIAGSRELIDYLTQFARPYIYTTGMPPALAAGALAALEIMRREPAQRARLQQLIDYFRARARELQLPLADSASAIQPLILGDARAVLRLGAQLRGKGFLVGAIRPPTVPVGSARLRITLSANHSEAQIDGLLDALVTSLRAEATA